MMLKFSSWPEIDDYLKTSKAILIPVGSIEQHGPTGFLGTDAICPEVIAERAATETNMLVAPTFNVGSAQHHLAFPGSISLRPSTMIAAMCDWTSSLVRQGFERIYWFNGHGGNIAPIESAIAEIYAGRSFARGAAEAGGLKLKLRGWWQFPEVAALHGKLYGDQDGDHATASEISVTLSRYPEYEKTQELVPVVAPAFSGIHDADDYRKRYPDGRIGSNPALSNAEDGAAIVEVAAKALAKDFEAFASG